MTVQTPLDEVSSLYLERFGQLRDRLPGAGLSWLADVRDAGATAFGETGFPGRKTEAWHYTSLAQLKKTDFAADPEPMPVEQASLPALVYGRESTCRLVFVNGAFRPDLSTIADLPGGATLVSFREALAEWPDLIETGLQGQASNPDDPLAALNAAFMSDGFVLHLKEGVSLDAPVEILAVGTGAAQAPVYHTRNLVIAERDSRATIVEHHVGLCISSYFSNQATNFLLGEGALVRHCKVQDESREAFHIAHNTACLAAGAQFDSFSFALGGALSRNEIHVRLEAPGATCRLNGAYLMKGRQHCDNTTVVDHLAPDTSCRELYKGVLDGQAHGVFQGRITVHPDAQRTDGQQMNRALLLSDKAEMSSKPELEIYADDVKCAHGATVGELDHMALFYLRSRGIPEEAARGLLVEAFLGEVIDGIALAGMRLPLQENVAKWMGDRR